MANKSWFFAVDGKQQGPYPEAQFHDFIARGAITQDTLVWSEGMAGWQKAGEIPGLISGPPTLGGPGGGLVAGGALWLDVGVWSLLGRTLLYVIGMALVIPAPWTATSFYRWIVPRLKVPRRPDMAFTGQVGDIWYVFIILALCGYGGLTHYRSVQLILLPLQAFLSWMVLRWLVGNLSSNGQKLPVAFEGSALGYLGWYILMVVSLITIVGWAWVVTAWMRWTCRNITGTVREVVFNASGWGVLWRTVLTALACSLIIPIPWMLRWYTRWYASQFALVERGSYAHA